MTGTVLRTGIEITDVFLRDGLQDEEVFVPTERKLAVADRLIGAGLRRIEATSFVNPARVPQTADAAELLAALPRREEVSYTVLALNGRGIERAVAAGAEEVSVVASASQAHSSANAGRSTEEALRSLAEQVARFPGTRFSAGISTAFTCPFEGDIPVDRLLGIAAAFLDLGIRSLGLADTLGTTPTTHVLAAVEAVTERFPDIELSLHLHNAHGQAIGTALAAVELGVRRFDAALAGFGGCPFAPGAHGNVATEALVRAFHEAGYETGIDELRLGRAAEEARRAVAEGLPIATLTAP